MKTDNFNVVRRCLKVLAEIDHGEWVSCQYVAAAAIFPPEKTSRRQKGNSSFAAEGLYKLVKSGRAIRRKIGSTHRNEYQLTEKGWKLAREQGFVNQGAK